MAIAVTMNHNDEKDAHDHDMVMPGFRFHPTEEELIEFYLRRKVEGKRFNVELITFLDLYRYDPWELPALAAIGEKEWFFYVPRDRKYRNGDRPNRVTTSGYWKATGADRMIRTESGRSIGLKKTLVFYSGKAPKGIRTSWIMNEYRLPQHETDRYQKAEISLCRVHKRAGVDDSSISSGTSSSRGSVQFSDKRQQNIVHPSTISLQLLSSSSELEKPHEVATSSTSTTNTWTTLGLANHPLNSTLPPPRVLCEEDDQAVTDSRLMCVSPLKRPEFESYCIQKKDDQPDLRHRPKQVECSLFLQNSSTTLFNSPSSSSSSILVPVADDLHKIVNYQQAYTQQQQQQQQNHHQNASQFLQLPPHQEHQLVAPIDTVNSPNSLTPLTFQEKLWEWNLIPEANRNYNSTTTTTYHFK